MAKVVDEGTAAGIELRGARWGAPQFRQTSVGERVYRTASLNALPALKAGTLAAAILTSSPVCGLRPTRALRWRRSNVPKPVLSPVPGWRPSLQRWVRRAVGRVIRALNHFYFPHRHDLVRHDIDPCTRACPGCDSRAPRVETLRRRRSSQGWNPRSR